MDAEALKAQLQSEGFDVVYLQEDEPGMRHDTHTHDTHSAHIILKGSMDLVVLGQTHHLEPGDRFDIPMGAPHSAIVGSSGCTFLVGER